jgi:ABC-type uncharacterized transport system auxiliary subunit
MFSQFLQSGYLALIVCIGMVAYSGCSGIHQQKIIYYAFNYPSPEKEITESLPDTMMVYRFLLDRSVPLDALIVVKAKEKSATAYKWEENPADMISELLIRDLQSSGLFHRTVDQLSNVRYRYALEGTIQKLHGIIRDGKGSAVLEADISLTDFDAPPGELKTILKKKYEVEVPSTDTTPESIVQAMNSAVKQVSARLRTDIRSTVLRSGSPDEKTVGKMADESIVTLLRSRK